MDLSNVISEASKDFENYKRRKSVIVYVVLFPLILSVVFSLIVQNDIVSTSGISSQYQLGLLSLAYFYVVLSAVLPSSIAAYSIVGEKIEKSLEPLLATPMTDGEILAGKAAAAFGFPMLMIWIGSSIFMGATDYLTNPLLGYNYFPNIEAGIMLLVLAPLAAIFSIEISVIISSRVNDVRGANQIATLLFIPFIAVFVAAVSGSFAFDLETLLIFSGIVLIFDIALSFLSISTFNREEILTKWK